MTPWWRKRAQERRAQRRAEAEELARVLLTTAHHLTQEHGPTAEFWSDIRELVTGDLTWVRLGEIVQTLKDIGQPTHQQHVLPSWWWGAGDRLARLCVLLADKPWDSDISVTVRSLSPDWVGTADGLRAAAVLMYAV